MSEQEGASKSFRRRGGRSFPRVTLSDAANHAKKLYAKTISGPQPASIILKGVFGSGSDIGKIRASASKQYGFLEGDSKGYKASQLAKDLSVAAPESLQKILQKACLKPSLFKELQATFVGDTVSKSRVREQAGQLGVHADNLPQCVDIFCQSLEFAGLASVSGDDVTFAAADAAPATSVAPFESVGDELENGEVEPPPVKTNEDQEEARKHQDRAAASATSPEGNIGPSGRSVIHVNLNVDSSMDTDKLERQLSLLRKYGAI